MPDMTVANRWAAISPSWLDEVFEIDEVLGSGRESEIQEVLGCHKTQAELLGLTTRRAILREQIEAFRPATTAGDLTAPQLRVLHNAHWKYIGRASFYARHSYTSHTSSAVALFRLGLVTINVLDDEPGVEVTITQDGADLATTIWTTYEEGP